ncbi:MAG: PIN domain-containing protein [bacterium]
MKILFDTNVILDALLQRAPFDIAATRLLATVERQQISGFLAATTITTIDYLATRATDRRQAQQHISRLLMLFSIAPITHLVLADALLLPFTDFEDAVLHEAARQAGVDGIVTRNCTDFKGASLPIYTPDELLILLQALPWHGRDTHENEQI